jgi:hypothetical protein
MKFEIVIWKARTSWIVSAHKNGKPFICLARCKHKRTAEKIARAIRVAIERELQRLSLKIKLISELDLQTAKDL